MPVLKLRFKGMDWVRFESLPQGEKLIQAAQAEYLKWNPSLGWDSVALCLGRALHLPFCTSFYNFSFEISIHNDPWRGLTETDDAVSFQM